MKKVTKYMLEIHQEIGMLSARLDRIEAGLDAVLKVMSQIDGTVVKRLEALVTAASRQHDCTRELIKRMEVQEIDRGEAASALYGLQKRVDQLTKNMAREKA